MVVTTLSFYYIHTDSCRVNYFLYSLEFAFNNIISVMLLNRHSGVMTYPPQCVFKRSNSSCTYDGSAYHFFVLFWGRSACDLDVYLVFEMVDRAAFFLALPLEAGSVRELTLVWLMGT